MPATFSVEDDFDDEEEDEWDEAHGVHVQREVV